MSGWFIHPMNYTPVCLGTTINELYIGNGLIQDLFILYTTIFF